MFARKAALAAIGVVILPFGAKMQGIAALVVVNIALLSHFKSQPFYFDSADRLESVSLLTSQVFVVLGLRNDPSGSQVFIVVGTISSELGEAAGTLVAVMELSCLVVFGTIAYKVTSKFCASYSMGLIVISEV